MAMTIPISASSQQNDLTQGIALRSMSLRVAPDSSSTIIRYFKTYEVFTILQKVNSYWYKVQDNLGRTGYATANSAYMSVWANAILVSPMEIRQQPYDGATITKQLYAGNRLLIVAKMNDYWYSVKDTQNTSGYMRINDQAIQSDFSMIKITRPISEQIELTIQQAYRYWGTPYEFRSARLNPSTFDCSDFLQQITWDTSPVVLPSSSKDQGTFIKNKGNYTMDISQLKRGDLIFFMSYLGYSASNYAGIDKSTQTITHAGMYIGDGKMINTRSISSGGVRVDNLYEGAWKYRFMYGGSMW